jgi:hypothetical protein
MQNIYDQRFAAQLNWLRKGWDQREIRKGHPAWAKALLIP